MKFSLQRRDGPLCSPLSKKALRITKLITIILTTACMQVSAFSYAQDITLSEQNASLEKVFNDIVKQSEYRFWYESDLLKNTKKVTIDVKNASIREVLDLCLKGQPLSYSIIKAVIVIEPKALTPASLLQTPPPDTLRGKIINEQGVPIPGATIAIKGTNTATIADGKGNFSFSKLRNDAILVVTSVGYEKQEIQVKGKPFINIALKKALNKLDEAVVIAYGKTTQRLNTGDVSTVTAEEIEKQPISNPLAALEGRVPGLTVVQNSGLPGSSFKVQLRGRTSVNTGISDDPLFIINGVPFANNNNSINSIGMALTSTGGLSPFDLINPSDIESITVLKDADATSIYGSRGANGVILITTKKGKAGKTQITANIYSGISNVPRKMKLMNTQQYLAMRHEAFANDGVTPTASNAPDLFLLDTSHYTDWQHYFIGNTAHTLDANLSFSGGNNQTQFLIGGGYHNATTVFPGDLNDSRASAHFNINHHSADERFNLIFSGGGAEDRNHLDAQDLTQYSILLPPDNPPLYNNAGNLNFSENGYSFDNPLSYLEKYYMAKTDNYIASLFLSYQLFKGFSIKSNFGYNAIYVNEIETNPIESQNPVYNPVGYAQFSNSNYKSFIIEPQAEYNVLLGPGKLDVLLGGSWQENTSENTFIYAAGYTNDALIQSLGAAGEILSNSNSSTQYKYAAVFGRINYNILNRYILNISGRRDGSSRFGPGRQFADFGAVGMGWIFSSEKFVKNIFPSLSFGKLRGSYGTSGNDEIGDYQYLDTWTPPSQTYLNNSGLYPTRLFNPNYSWELNKKLELGLDLGFVRDRILFTASYYQSRSSNELVQYALPAQTGGSSITANFPAVVQNTGWEFSLNTTNMKSKSFSWNTNFNLTIPKNELISFPNLSNSSYYALLLVGKSLNIGSGLRVKGINPTTGVYDILAKDGSATSSPEFTDMILGLYNTDPKFYGGIGNELRYKGIELSFFFDYKKQIGKNYLGNLFGIRKYPGEAFDFPVDVINRWTPNNTVTSIQKYTTSPTAPAYQAANDMRLYLADIFYSDASFIRLRTISLSYNLPNKMLNRMKIIGCKIYINVQNAFIITDFKGTDPEIQNIFVLPQLRTFVGGIQVTL